MSVTFFTLAAIV